MVAVSMPGPATFLPARPGIHSPPVSLSCVRATMCSTRWCSLNESVSDSSPRAPEEVGFGDGGCAQSLCCGNRYCQNIITYGKAEMGQYWPYRIGGSPSSAKISAAGGRGDSDTCARLDTGFCLYQVLDGEAAGIVGSGDLTGLKISHVRANVQSERPALLDRGV